MHTYKVRQAWRCVGAAKREKVVAAVRQAIMLPDLTGWERQSLREMLETHLQGTLPQLRMLTHMVLAHGTHNLGDAVCGSAACVHYCTGKVCFCIGIVCREP